ncbi:LysR family transcriptional regulator [Albimonas pacifica]|uniref:DNA-binding transcriptional regulator, LysR family n=1 Tax=Albimonas pacifica TaxID=1114924 RepID=A0A1I3FT41_9RHOB|nr:LysR family transcriptional regulator [Albimonas pacifica]SFI14369.1 DNA-binding transcriptional regulator, LysR family [Albimonas pacifica]
MTPSASPDALEISRNLRHLRVFLEVADAGSLTLAAERAHVSQPAVTQAINKLERQAGGDLFRRTRQGFFLTERGEVLALRVRRALARLDPALVEVSPRLRLTASAAQLHALIGVCEAENFTLAARKLGLAQPTVHRAVTQLEQEAARALFERTSFGIVPTRPCQALAQAARLAFSELDQADADLAEHDGREGGRVVVGALPLSRSVILPRALAEFRRRRPVQPITVHDGLYEDLLAGLRRGEIDFILGALRQPAPIADVRQEPLFEDRLAVLARRDHPLAGRRGLTMADLAGEGWVVTRRGVPSRDQFDAAFASRGLPAPERLLETGSILLMREILSASDDLGCISGVQAEAEVSKGLLARLDVAEDWPGRPIGLTLRRDWQPTRAQDELMALIRKHASEAAPR